MSERTEVILEGTFQQNDQGRFVALPFDVPPHIGRVDVHLEFSDKTGTEPWETEGNALDIGIFDPRENDDPRKGFRGWSGSARMDFSIDGDTATPGYISGPIQQGTWHILLGLFKIWHKGCDYKLTITLTHDVPNNTPAEFPIQLPLRTEAKREASATGWYKGDLHCHSFHSDGDSDPINVVKEAERLGLDFLAVTDHNTLSHQVALNTIDTEVMLIPGVEITTFSGHWNIWGDFDWIDFRVDSAEKMDATIQEANRRGYLTSCNHPRPNGPAWKFENVESFNCIEVWNSPWLIEHNHHCLSFWETRLNQGKRFVAVGGSDNHELKNAAESHLGQATTYIYCDGEISPARLLQALRAGHAFVTCAPDGPQIYLLSGTAMMGDSILRPSNNQLKLQIEVLRGDGGQLEVCTAKGVSESILITGNQTKLELEVDIKDTSYVRVQLRRLEDNSMLVLSNPIYLDD
ncbi:MAG: PHP domain-containing protein [Anaerolineae bacterium]|nr:PHP domain-containing protein [Anaerolineae bacterium]